jgi:hypothetical protein
MTSHLPAGWTVERLRSASGDPEATALATDRVVSIDMLGQQPVVVQAAFVLAFHELCLVRTTDDDDWYMGALSNDGSIACWASYGSDLDQAIRGL